MEWVKVREFADEFQDTIYEKKEGMAKITINRPHKLNAFTSRTLEEMVQALWDANADPEIGVVIITGAGDRAFSSGGDVAWERETGARPRRDARVDIYRAIRECVKPVIAMVNGWCIGGASVLASVCDLTIASENARFGQNGPRVGSFNSGWGCAYQARLVGQKKAREMWMLCRHYSAQEAVEMGLVNKVVPQNKLEEEVEQWCQEILALSPTALKGCKIQFNAETDLIQGYTALGQQVLQMLQGSEEAHEAQQAFFEKRKADFSKFRK